MLCVEFQLPYSYIQYTNGSWSASLYDADEGNQDHHPVPRGLGSHSESFGEPHRIQRTVFIFW